MFENAILLWQIHKTTNMDPALAAAQVVRVVDDCLALCRQISELLTAHPAILSGASVTGLQKKLSEIHDVYASEKFEALIELRGGEGIAVLQSTLSDERDKWADELVDSPALHDLLQSDSKFYSACCALTDGLDTISLPDPSKLAYLATYPGQEITSYDDEDTQPYTRNQRRMFTFSSVLGALIALFGAVQLREQLGVPLFGIELGVFDPNPGHTWARMLFSPLCAYLSGLTLLLQHRGYAGDGGKLLAFWLGYEVAYLQGWWDGLEPTALLLGYVPSWILAAQLVCWAMNCHPAIRRMREQGRKEKARAVRCAEELV